MKYTYARTIKVISMGLIGTLITTLGAMVWAGNSTDTPALALRKIMQDLDKNMQLMAAGISREDWPLVGEIALQIAEHRLPPFSEKIRIMGFVGTSIGKYKAYDGSIYEQAQAVGKAAKSSDGHGARLMFRQLLTSCDNCHSEFRKSFVAHFYNRGDATPPFTVSPSGAIP